MQGSNAESLIFIWFFKTSSYVCPWTLLHETWKERGSAEIELFSCGQGSHVMIMHGDAMYWTMGHVRRMVWDDSPDMG